MTISGKPVLFISEIKRRLFSQIFCQASPLKNWSRAINGERIKSV
jgi:hypothetical protein